jgi:hypothetical protein
MQRVPPSSSAVAPRGIVGFSPRRNPYRKTMMFPDLPLPRLYGLILKALYLGTNPCYEVHLPSAFQPSTVG